MRFKRGGDLLFALGYCSVAVVLGLLLWVIRRETDPVVIVLAVVQVVLAGGLAHEVMTRRSNESKIMERLGRMRQSYADLAGLILTTRVPRAACDAPEPALDGDDEPAVVAPRPSVRAVRAVRAGVSEVRPPPLILSQEEAEIAATLRRALAENRVEVYLQPIVRLSHRKHCGYELLSRIRMPDGSLLEPDFFHKVAESEALLPEMDVLLLNRVGQMIRETDRHGHAINFFCNISPSTLTDRSFMADFLGAGGDPHGLRAKLVFEMTQRDLEAEMGTSMGVVAELALVGFRFSIDNVDNLDIDPAVLVRSEVRFIKLNAGFLSVPERRLEIVELLRRIGGQPIEVIAERIECESQVAEALELGIEVGQGILFGEPRPSRRPS
ncbi:MAG: EAL domain-containing protein [Rhodospirillaceae bacterium]